MYKGGSYQFVRSTSGDRLEPLPVSEQGEGH